MMPSSSPVQALLLILSLSHSLFPQLFPISVFSSSLVEWLVQLQQQQQPFFPFVPITLQWDLSNGVSRSKTPLNHFVGLRPLSPSALLTADRREEKSPVQKTKGQLASRLARERECLITVLFSQGLFSGGASDRRGDQQQYAVECSAYRLYGLLQLQNADPKINQPKKLEEVTHRRYIYTYNYLHTHSLNESMAKSNNCHIFNICITKLILVGDYREERQCLRYCKHSSGSHRTLF